MSIGNLAYGGVQRSYSFPFAAAHRLIGIIARQQMPDVPCEQVVFRAHPSNTGNVYIGGNDVSSVQGIPLEPGDWSPWFPIQNLKILYYVCDNTASHLQYFTVR